MPLDAAPPEFHLHFEGEGARDHSVPGSALAQAIQALQRSVHLLAMAHEGRDLGQRLRISYELERKYALVFKLPDKGGYDIPYIIGNTAGTLFDPNDVAVVTEQHQAVLAAVQANDTPALKRLIPLALIRRQVAAALKDMQPPARMGLVVSIEDYRQQKLLDGRTASERLAPILNEPVTPSVHPRLVTGRLDALDFQRRSLELQLPTGRRLECSYNEDYEPVLLENRREWIQVRGEAVLDENDQLKALNNITEILEVDDSPVAVDALTVDGTTLAAAKPLIFPVEFDPEEGFYTATGAFHMLVTGGTRAEIEAAVAEALAILWHEYVLADSDDFSADALSLRDELIGAF